MAKKKKTGKKGKSASSSTAKISNRLKAKAKTSARKANTAYKTKAGR